VHLNIYLLIYIQVLFVCWRRVQKSNRLISMVGCRFDYFGHCVAYLLSQMDSEHDASRRNSYKD